MTLRSSILESEMLANHRFAGTSFPHKRAQNRLCQQFYWLRNWAGLRREIRGYLLAAITLFASALLNPAFADPNQAFDNASYRNIRLSHIDFSPSYSDIEVTDILQDNHGYMWFATVEGLVRYDGYESKLYVNGRSNPDSLSVDRLTALYVDRAGILWVGTDGAGLNRYDAATDTFARFVHQPGNPTSLSDNRVQAIHQDENGTLWVGTKAGGLNALAPDKSEFVVYHHDPQDPNSLPHEQVTDIVEDANGNLWIGTNGGGLARLDRVADHFIVYQADNTTSNSLSDNRINKIYEDPLHQLWVGTKNGLNLFDDQRQNFVHFRHDKDDDKSLSSNVITDLLVDGKGSFWVATKKGLNERLASGAFNHYNHDRTDNTSLASNRLSSLYQDKTGSLWIGSDQGVNKWNYFSDAFAYYEIKGADGNNSSVTTVAENGLGQIWLGTKDEGLIRINRESNTLSKFVHDPDDAHSLPSDDITALYVDHADQLWIGTKQGHVASLKLEATQFQTILKPTEDSASNSAISVITASVTSSTSPQIWIGTAGDGLWRLQDDSLEHYFHGPAASDEDTASDQRIPANHITAMLADRDGQLWLGSKEAGISRYSPKLDRFAPLTSFGELTVLQITETKNGDLWISTDGEGLYQWSAQLRASQQEVFEAFSKEQGLPSHTIIGVLEDQYGTLWLSSNRGITNLDPTTQLVRHFDARNGLRGHRFQHNARIASRSGQLLFGSRSGLMNFYPSAVARSQSEPFIVIEATSQDKLLGRSLGNQPMTEAIELGYPYYDISFDFRALHFVSPDKNKLAYKLDGFDEDWMDPKNVLRATYTNLPPGEYQFVVKASNNDGVWNSKGAAISLQVISPPWKSYLAYTLYAVVGLMLVLGFFVTQRRKIKQITINQHQLKADVEVRTLELAKQNRELEEVNAKLQSASITDPLTGLLNRRFFSEFIGTEVSKVERGYTAGIEGTDEIVISTSLFFMMIDLDGFKPINDRFGHHTGDHTLVQVSELLSACARDSDTVFRWGGDEFLIVGQVNAPGDMEILAERFRKIIADHRFDPKYGKALRLTASIGAAPYPFSEFNPGVATWEQVSDIADRGAYLAKTHGKNAWVSLKASADLDPKALVNVGKNLDQMIKDGKVLASTSETAIPIPGAVQR